MPVHLQGRTIVTSGLLRPGSRVTNFEQGEGVVSHLVVNKVGDGCTKHTVEYGL